MRGSLVNFGDARLPERFWDKVAPCPMSGCWLWTATTMPHGYGQASGINREGQMLAHRLSFSVLVGVIPDGLHIDHLCRQRCCVNPAHLEAVSIAENNRRVVRKPSTRTACDKGHSYVNGTFAVYARKRICLICKRATERDEYHRRKQAACRA